MHGTKTGYASDFPDKKGNFKEVTADHGVVTVTAGQSRTGDHAALIMEYMVSNMPFTRMVDLRLADDVGLKEAFGSKANREAGKSGISIKDTGPVGDDGLHFEHEKWVYTSYPMNDGQKVALQNAIDKFKQKNLNGRYEYRLAGGLVGRVFTRPGKRGINCADFVIKVLADAKIARISEMPLSLPGQVAKRKGSVFVDAA